MTTDFQQKTFYKLLDCMTEIYNDTINRTTKMGTHYCQKYQFSGTSISCMKVMGLVKVEKDKTRMNYGTLKWVSPNSPTKHIASKLLETIKLDNKRSRVIRKEKIVKEQPLIITGTPIEVEPKFDLNIIKDELLAIHTNFTQMLIKLNILNQ